MTKLSPPQAQQPPTNPPPPIPSPAPSGANVTRCDMCSVPIRNYNPTLMRRCSFCDKLIQDWQQCTRWSDLLDLNREFIKGKRVATPYAIYPIFENRELRPALLSLHDYGLLVIDAQDNNIYIGQEMSGPHMGKWYEVKERAYLTCLIPTNEPRLAKEKIDKLICHLFHMKDIEYVSYYEYSEYTEGVDVEGRYMAVPIGTTQEQITNGTGQYKMFYSTIGPSRAVNTVAKHRWALTKEELKWKPWRRCERNRLPVIFESDIPMNSMGARAFGQQLPMTLGMKPLIMTLAARNWPPTEMDLVKRLEQTLIHVGFETMFTKVESGGQNGGVQKEVAQSVAVEDGTVQGGAVPVETTKGERQRTGAVSMPHEEINASGRLERAAQQGRKDQGEAQITEKFQRLSLMEDVD